MRLVRTRLLPVPGLFLLALALPGFLPAATADEVETEKAPATVLLEPRPFRVVLDLDGSFEPKGAVEIAYRPESYGGALEVKSAVGASQVVKGQILVAFSTEEIDEQIENRRRDVRLAELKLQKQEEDGRRREESVEIQLAQAEVRRRTAREELDLFLNVHKPSRIEQAEFGLQGTEYRVQDEVEEYAQLEKMYNADDLTEETEEIVLKRAKRSLERSRRSLEFARERHRLFLEVTLPREEEGLRLEVRKQENDYAGIVATSKIGLEQAAVELEKARADVARQQKALAELEQDRKGLVITSPADGYAVPGSFGGGKWAKLGEMREALQPGNRVGLRQVLYTIVRPGNVGVVASVSEADLLDVQPGQPARVLPAVLDDVALSAVISSVMPVGGGGKYEVKLDLQETEKHLMPGQGCKIEVETRRTERALTVPKAALRKKGDKTLVWVWEDGAAHARKVRTGATSEERVEILDGLRAGEKVLEKAPEGE